MGFRGGAYRRKAEFRESVLGRRTRSWKFQTRLGLVMELETDKPHQGDRSQR